MADDDASSIAETNAARLFVFGRGATIDCEIFPDTNAISRIPAIEPTTNGVNTDMSKSNVNPLVPTRAAKTATRKGRATPLRTPPGEKRGHNLVPGLSGPHARFPRSRRVPVPRPAGAAPPLTPKEATKKPRVKLQRPDKRSKRPTPQKGATSRDDIGALPVNGAVVGPFGRGLPRRRPQPRT